MDNQTPTESKPGTNNNLQGKLKSNKTPLLIIVLAILTGLLLIFALAPKSTPPSNTGNNSAQNATPSAPAEAVLTFGNATSSGSVDNVDVIANTGNAATTAVQLEMSFDPKMVSNIAITPGDFVKGWSVLIKNIDYTNGRISFAIGMPLGASGIKGMGTVAHLSFTETGAKGQTIQITMLPKTLVSIQGFAGSSVKSTSNFTKVIGSTQSAAPSTTTSGGQY